MFFVLKYSEKNKKARKRPQQSQRERKVILQVNQNPSQNVKKQNLTKKNQKKTKRKKLIKKHKMEENYRQCLDFKTNF